MIRVIVIAIFSMLITSSLAYGLHTVQQNHLISSYETKLADQKNALTASCNKDKAITEKVSHDYQTKISALDDQLKHTHLLYRNLRITIKGAGGGGLNGSPGAGKSPRSGACPDPSVDGDDYLNVLAEGERYRIQVIALQNFISEIQAP